MTALLGFFARIISYPLIIAYQLVKSYGISIIILTLFVRLCILPLYSKQISYSAEMAELQPKLKEIQTKYARDKETMNLKTQELYREAGINPASGCLPLLIQMPIIMGLYQLLRYPLNFINANFMVMAVHESFLWVSDLSQPDPWILPLLAGITTYFTYQATQSAADTGNGAQAGMMKAMQYVFPIMIFAMGRSFPAGLTLYWIIGNLFTIVQTMLLSRRRKNKKLKAEALMQAKKNLKEEAAK